MTQNSNIHIYSKTSDIPTEWDKIADHNIFLQKSYLNILENTPPTNMTCYFVGYFIEKQLVGIALAQIISVREVQSFGVKKNCLQAKLRDFVFRNFANNVLFIGNNMLTGQNAVRFDDNIPTETQLDFIYNSVESIKQKYKAENKKIHIVSIKDFDEIEIEKFSVPKFKSYYRFEIQPNMIFDIPDNWHTHQNYIDALSKKYRDQYKRAHKKIDGVIKQKMGLDDIIHHNQTINELYLNVTRNAPFNTFYLSERHFIDFKKNLGNNFLFYAYFYNDKMIGFNTLIKNGTSMDTYFLGYDDDFQKEKMLYLNMLYDMIGYSINKGFKEVVFARTALEIKSSVGAKPLKMYGLIQHRNKIINKLMPKLFKFFEPEVKWQERNPFK